MNPYSKEYMVANWREKLGIKVGMSKEEALDKFIEWRLTKKTCQRCEGETLVEYCPLKLICEEAENVRNAEGNDHRRRTSEAAEPQTVRTNISKARKRNPIR